MSDLKIGAIVVCKASLRGPRGEIVRMARDGSWCDVRWVGRIAAESPLEVWSKRMKAEVLVTYDPIMSKREG